MMSKNGDLILVFSGLDKKEKNSILSKVTKSVKDNKVNFKSFDFMDEVALFSHIKNDLAGEYNQDVINDNELFLKSCDLYNEIDESGNKDSYASISYENGTEGLENNDDYSNMIKDFFNSECKNILDDEEIDDEDIEEDEEDD